MGTGTIKKNQPKDYRKFYGEIEKDSKNRFRCEKFEYIKLKETDSIYELIFTNGLLYPNFFNRVSLNISNLKELDFLTTPQTINHNQKTPEWTKSESLLIIFLQ